MIGLLTFMVLSVCVITFMSYLFTNLTKTWPIAVGLIIIIIALNIK